MLVRRIVCLKKNLFELLKIFKKYKKGLCNSHRTSLRKFIDEHLDVVNAILKNIEITRNHLTPELKLSLLTKNCPLYRQMEDSRFDQKRIPGPVLVYIYWPGDQTLTRFILDERKKNFRTHNTACEKRCIKDAAIATKLTIGT